MDWTVLQRASLALYSWALCCSVQSAREQQSLRTWPVLLFLVTLVMAYSQGEWPDVRFTAQMRLGSAVGLLGRWRLVISASLWGAGATSLVSIFWFLWMQCMTFNASATKSHRLLEPCASAALLSFISSHLLRQALLHLRRFLAPRYRSWGLCCELATATGASTTEQKRSGCLPPVMRGASLSFSCGRMVHGDSATTMLALTVWIVTHRRWHRGPSSFPCFYLTATVTQRWWGSDNTLLCLRQSCSNARRLLCRRLIRVRVFDLWYCWIAAVSLWQTVSECWCWALPRSLVACWFFAAERKSGWGICGSLLCFCCFVWLCQRICHRWAFWVLFTLIFHCLRNCKDRA